MTVRQIEGEFATVVDVLRAAAVVNADVEAYVEPETADAPRRPLTFAQWDRAADGVAGFLADHGVTRGSVVCLMLPSSIDYMVAYAAATRLGAITSGVNLRLGKPEVSSILDRTRPAVTVVEDEDLHPAGPSGAVLDRSTLAAAMVGPPPTRWPGLESSDPVAVVWTSGTTGLPKGAVFDHACLAAVAAGTDVLSEPGDRRLSPLPFAHVGSMTRTWDEIANGSHHGDHAHTVEGGRRHPRHRRRADHRGPGCPHPMVTGAGPSRPRGDRHLLAADRGHRGVPGAA